jgi:hypothetical protein
MPQVLGRFPLIPTGRTATDRSHRNRLATTANAKQMPTSGPLELPRWHFPRSETLSRSWKTGQSGIVAVCWAFSVWWAFLQCGSGVNAGRISPTALRCVGDFRMAWTFASRLGAVSDIDPGKHNRPGVTWPAVPNSGFGKKLLGTFLGLLGLRRRLGLGGLRGGGLLRGGLRSHFPWLLWRQETGADSR